MPPAAPPIVQLNDPRKLKISLRRLGRDRNPLLVVDDVLANAEEIRAHALGCQFRAPTRGGGYYPGYLAPCALRGVDRVGRWAARYLWREAYELDDDDRASRLHQVEVDSFFAVCAPAPRERYVNVHVDGHSWLAMLIYLTPGEERASGTAFWRHVPTGLESVYNGPEPLRRIAVLEGLFGVELFDPARQPLVYSGEPTYQRWISTLMPAAVKAPFPDRDHGAWKRIGVVGARFNRLVVYPTWQFHSISMRKAQRPGSLEAARLTLNGFLKHPLIESLERMPAAPLAGIAAD
jgi:hypothetical protein